MTTEPVYRRQSATEAVQRVYAEQPLLWMRWLFYLVPNYPKRCRFCQLGFPKSKPDPWPQPGQREKPLTTERFRFRLEIRVTTT